MHTLFYSILRLFCDIAFEAHSDTGKQQIAEWQLFNQLTTHPMLGLRLLHFRLWHLCCWRHNRNSVMPSRSQDPSTFSICPLMHVISSFVSLPLSQNNTRSRDLWQEFPKVWNQQNPLFYQEEKCASPNLNGSYAKLLNTSNYCGCWESWMVRFFFIIYSLYCEAIYDKRRKEQNCKAIICIIICTLIGS